ncbi:MAG TPA: hypothetical protein VKZ63_15510 [Kofleriaceae bacterium]|nr:hypothetical protein [Kofleriaceae bacterium]
MTGHPLHIALRTAARVAALVGAFVAVYGSVLVWGTEPESGAGLGQALMVVFGAALLVMAGLTCLAAAVLWLASLRSEGELRRKTRVLGWR